MCSVCLNIEVVATQSNRTQVLSGSSVFSIKLVQQCNGPLHRRASLLTASGPNMQNCSIGLGLRFSAKSCSISAPKVRLIGTKALRWLVGVGLPIVHHLGNSHCLLHVSEVGRLYGHSALAMIVRAEYRVLRNHILRYYIH